MIQTIPQLSRPYSLYIQLSLAYPIPSVTCPICSQMSKEIYFPKRGGKKQAKKFKRWLMKQADQNLNLQNLTTHYNKEGARKKTLNHFERQIEKQKAARERQELRLQIENPYNYNFNTIEIPAPIKTNLPTTTEIKEPRPTLKPTKTNQPLNEQMEWLDDEPEIKQLLAETQTLKEELERAKREVSKRILQNFTTSIRPPPIMSPIREKYPATSAKDNAQALMDPPTQPSSSPYLDLFLDEDFVLEF